MPEPSSKLQKAALLACIVFFIASAAIFAYQAYAFAIRGPAIAPSGETQTTPPPRDEFFRGVSHDSPIVLLYSFFGMATSALAAAVIYSRASVKEKVAEKHRVDFIKVQPDGKRLVGLLQGSKGTLTQSELVRKSGMDKLRVSRALKKLEKLSVVRKHPYGMTNSITLEPGIRLE